MEFLRRLFRLDGHPPPAVPCRRDVPSEAERRLEQAHREALQMLSRAERETARTQKRVISWESLMNLPGYEERER